MPTIYLWLQPVTVTQARYNKLIGREGWFATPTRLTQSVKPLSDSDGVISLASYKGAVGDAATDSTDAIQAAMNKAVAVGARLYVPPGEYLVTQLVAPAGLVMTGQTPSGSGIDVTKQTRFSLKSGTNAHMLVGTQGSAHVRISNIHFDGNKNNNTSGDIIHLDDVATAEECQWHIRDCFIDAGAGYGIYVGSGRRAVQISDNTLNYCRLSGARINGSDAHVDRCIVGTNMEHGIGVGGTVCNINDCDIYGNGTDGDTNTGDGISVFSTLTQVNIRGNRIDQNKRHGVLVGSNCESIIVDNNVFHGNSQHGNGSHHGVSILSTKGSITVNANTFSVDGNVSNKSGYAINFAAGATAVGGGNVVQANATVNGLTNTPRALTQTRLAGKMSLWSPTVAVAENIDRAYGLVGTQTAVLTSGRLQLVGGFIVPGGQKVNRATFFSAGTNTAALTNSWAVLINANDNSIIGKSADFGSTAWGQFATRTFVFSDYLPWVDVPVYVGLVCVGTTMPSLRTLNANSSTNGVAPMIAATANTGLTDPASLTSVGALSATDMLPYCYLSLA